MNRAALGKEQNEPNTGTFVRYSWRWNGALAWSKRLMEAKISQASQRAKQLAAAEAYLEQAKGIEKSVRDLVKSDRLAKTSIPRVVYFRADAEYLVARLKEAHAGNKQALAQAAKARHEAAKAAEDATWNVVLELRAEPEQAYESSSRVRDAALDMATNIAEPVSAVEHHLSRMKSVAERIKQVFDAGRIGAYEYWATQYYVAEAEIQLAQLKGN